MAISLTLFYGSPNARNGAAASLGSIARKSQKLNAIALSQLRVSLAAVLFLTSLAPCGAGHSLCSDGKPRTYLRCAYRCRPARNRHGGLCADRLARRIGFSSGSGFTSLCGAYDPDPPFPWSAESRKEGRSPEMNPQVRD